MSSTRYCFVTQRSVFTISPVKTWFKSSFKRFKSYYNKKQMVWGLQGVCPTKARNLENSQTFARIWCSIVLCIVQRIVLNRTSGTILVLPTPVTQDNIMGHQKRSKLCDVSKFLAIKFLFVIRLKSFKRRFKSCLRQDIASLPSEACLQSRP